jgi:uncharacterized protein (DUF2267 family)
MHYDEFLSKVRERGEYADVVEAQGVTRIVLRRLGQRVGSEAADVAAQLPPQFHDAMSASAGADGDLADSAGVKEFLQRVATDLSATPETAVWDASAVLSTLAEAVTGGQLNQLLSQLQPAYAELFGKPELA